MRTNATAWGVIGRASVMANALILSVLSRGAFAQRCETTLLPGPSDEVPGVNYEVFASVVWDPDEAEPGAPQLVAGGVFTVAGRVDAAGVARWDPALRGGRGDWRALGEGPGGTYPRTMALAVIDFDGPGGDGSQLIAGGSFSVQRWAPSGNDGLGAWIPLGGGLGSGVRVLTTWNPDGEGLGRSELVAGGEFSTRNGHVADGVARWDPAAEGGAGAWVQFGTGLSGDAPGLRVNALVAWDPDGVAGPIRQRLVVAGRFSGAGGIAASNLAQWDPSGNDGIGEWLPFEAGVGHEVYALLAWDPDGDGPATENLVIGGSPIDSAGMAIANIARWDPSANGGAGDWLRFGSGINSRVYSLASWDPDGPGPGPVLLVAGGSFRRADNLDAVNIASWDPTANAGRGAWNTLGAGIGGAWVNCITPWDPDTSDPEGERLIVGGHFFSAGGSGASNIAECFADTRGSVPSWRALGFGMSAYVGELATWTPPGSGDSAPSIVAAVGSVRTDTADAIAIARWAGSGSGGAGAWHPFNNAINSTIDAITTWDPDGTGPIEPELVAGGWFFSAGAPGTLSIARWDPFGAGDQGAWRPFAFGLDWVVFALTSWDLDGLGPAQQELVAGGMFGTAGYYEGMQHPIAHVARWDPAARGGLGAWRPLGSGVNRPVYDILAWDRETNGSHAPNLVVAGEFTLAGGIPANRIARWFPGADGGNGAWRTLGLGMDDWVGAMTLWDPDGDGPRPRQLIVGGAFSTAGGVAASRVARWDPAASEKQGAWFPLGEGLNEWVLCLATWDPDGEGPEPVQLVAGGRFFASGNTPIQSLAVWDPDASESGGAWRSFGPRPDRAVFALQVWDPDAPGRIPPRLAVGGEFIRVGEHISPHLALLGRDCLCPGDADGTLAVTFADITTILEHWGDVYSIATGLGDPTGDGVVDFRDIESVLVNFNHACP